MNGERCARCNGFVIPERLIDQTPAGSRGFEVGGWRCVICGCRGEGARQYGLEIGSLEQPGRRGAVHQYKGSGYEGEEDGD